MSALSPAREWTVPEIDHADFAAYYGATWPRLVAYVMPLVGSRVDAEEIAQEAFARLLPRWHTVSEAGEPEAWLRTVSYRLAVSNWRRLRHAAAYLARTRIRHVPAPSEDTLLILQVLRPLSMSHRQVLILHYGRGLSVDEIARELGVPAGTIKSRLSRARAAAATGQWEGNADV